MRDDVSETGSKASLPREAGPHALHLRRLGIDTYGEPVIYMRADCHVCRAEGFEARSRVEVRLRGRSLIATLNVVAGELRTIVADVVGGKYSDLHLAAFVTACAGGRLDIDETVALTRAMVEAGERLEWGRPIIADKHCVGGLPGNRTTLLVVPIVAAAGVVIPKTSSRAITSPAGTADTMEVLAPVDLDIPAMRRVVEREGGCVVWGGAARLSPADDVLIRVERPLDFDSEAQLLASVLSKKVAAGATHVVIDVPVGPTAKVRSVHAAARLAAQFYTVAEQLGLSLRVVTTDGSQPVGRGIGPALEARDVLAVLRGTPDAPADLRDRALLLAGELLEFTGGARAGEGRAFAATILASGRALAKFETICEAQGGRRIPPQPSHTEVVMCTRPGVVVEIDNRRLARIAKLAGAPRAPAAGVDLHVKIGARVSVGQPLFTVHAQAPGELAYSLDFLRRQPAPIRTEDRS